MDQTLKVEFDHGLVEEAVFLAPRFNAKYRESEWVQKWNDERERIYEIPDAAKREKTFRLFYEKTFSEMGLRAFFENVVAEFPLLRTVSSLFVRRVFSVKEESSELFVRQGFKKIVVSMRVARAVDPSESLKFLRHELLRVSDMLDSAFEYKADAVFGCDDEVTNNLIRDRYRVLWDLYISARLDRRKVETLAAFAHYQGLLNKAFSQWPAPLQASIFDGIQNGLSWTQTGLLALAEDKQYGLVGT